MNRKHSFAAHLYPLLIAFLLSGGGVLYFNNRFGMRMNDFVLLFVIAAFLVLIWVFDRLKKHWPILLTGIFLLAAVAFCIGLAAFLPAGGGGNITDWWLLYNPKYDTDYNLNYALLTVCIYVYCAGLASYFLQKLLALRVICMAGIIGILVWLGVSSEEVPFFTLAFAVTYLISVLVEICFRTSSRQKKQISSGLVALFLFPVSFLTSVITVSLPRKEEPIDWSFMVEAYDTVEYWFSTLLANMGIYGQNGYEFGLNTLGFTGTSEELGGDLSMNFGKVMEVLFPGEKPRSGLYLAGSTQDTYTGRGWERNAVNFVSPYFENELDSIEMLYAMERYGTGTDTLDLAGVIPMKITYSDIFTRSVFMPQKAFFFNANSDGKSFPFSLYSYGALFDQPQRNAVYSTSFLDINYNSSLFRQFVVSESNYEYSYDAPYMPDISYWDVSTYLDTNSLMFSSDFEKELKDRSDWIRQNYTALPETLPERVHELTLEITLGYESDYDKLKAIEHYLSQNYEYTLTPGEVPEDRDFVDFFLFDNKKGYCTYFATAMAVMARSIGIPTRYVQGFSARCNQWIPGQESAYLVLKEEGHAWPEAYLEGVGWIPFEPTASRQGERYSDWEDEQTGPAVPSETPQETPEPNENQETFRPNLPEGEKNSFKLTSEQIFLICIGAILLLLLALLAACYFKINRYHKKYNRASVADKAYLDFREILLLLSRCGVRLEEGETLSAYVQRADHLFKTRTASLAEAAEVYTRLHYRGENINVGDLKKIQDMRNHLLSVVRQRFGRLRQFILRLRIEK